MGEGPGYPGTLAAPWDGPSSWAGAELQGAAPTACVARECRCPHHKGPTQGGNAQVVVADRPCLRDMLWSFVPDFGYSEHIIPLLLWFLSHLLPSSFLIRGHRRCWWALLGVTQFRNEQSYLRVLVVGPPQVLRSLPRNLCLLIHGFCCACLCPMRVGGSIPAPLWQPGPHLCAPHGDDSFPSPAVPRKATSSPQAMQVPPTPCCPGLEEKHSLAAPWQQHWCRGISLGEQHRSLAGVQHHSPDIPWGSPISFQGSAGCSALAIICPLSPHFSNSRAPLVPSPLL